MKRYRRYRSLVERTISGDGKEKRFAQPDFCIYDIVSFYHMAVAEDNSQKKAQPNSEPQLIAEAIAMHQNNLDIADKRPEKKQKTGGEEPSNEILGMRVSRYPFFFYKIPVSKPMLDVMRTRNGTQ
jgi:hypothetical protein